MFREVTLFDGSSHRASEPVVRLKQAYLVSFFKESVGCAESSDASTENGDVFAYDGYLVSGN